MGAPAATRPPAQPQMLLTQRARCRRDASTYAIEQTTRISDLPRRPILLVVLRALVLVLRRRCAICFAAQLLSLGAGGAPHFYSNWHCAATPSTPSSSSALTNALA